MQLYHRRHCKLLDFVICKLRLSSAIANNAPSQMLSLTPANAISAIDAIFCLHNERDHILPLTSFNLWDPV